jgi:hypothetical protein
MMLWFIACGTGLLGPVANIGRAGGLIVGLLAGVPVYAGHLRDRVDAPELTAGNWASEHIRGARRAVRQFVTPYVPCGSCGSRPGCCCSNVDGRENRVVDGTCLKRHVIRRDSRVARAARPGRGRAHGGGRRLCARSPA